MHDLGANLDHQRFHNHDVGQLQTIDPFRILAFDVYQHFNCFIMCIIIIII